MLIHLSLPLSLSFSFAGLQARDQLGAHCENRWIDGRCVVGDFGCIYFGFDILAGACIMRPNANIGLDLGEGIDAGDTATGERLVSAPSTRQSKRVFYSKSPFSAPSSNCVLIKYSSTVDHTGAGRRPITRIHHDYTIQRENVSQSSVQFSRGFVHISSAPMSPNGIQMTFAFPPARLTCIAISLAAVVVAQLLPHPSSYFVHNSIVLQHAREQHPFARKIFEESTRHVDFIRCGESFRCRHKPAM